MGVLDLADRTWPLLRRLTGAHTFAYRATRGVVGHRVPGLGLGPMLLLEHVGAKSERRRTSPLVYVRDGSERRPVRARVATAAERPRLWDAALRTYAGYRGYQERTEREIPLVVLERRQVAPS